MGILDKNFNSKEDLNALGIFALQDIAKMKELMIIATDSSSKCAKGVIYISLMVVSVRT